MDVELNDDDVIRSVQTGVAIGERSCSEVVADTLEVWGDAADAAQRESRVWQLADTEFRAHLAAQAEWPEVTDNDRLTLAFRQLDVAGIVAREDFTCCQTCGGSEIGEDLGDGQTARGYTFYHRQDTEYAAVSGVLFLSYGCLGEPLPQSTEGRGADAQIGREVAEALRRQGLTVEWDGDARLRIEVQLTWRRRRTGRLAAVPAQVDGRGAGDPVQVKVLDPLDSNHLPDDGLMPPAQLAGLYLPWLPADTRVKVEAGGRVLAVRREGSSLAATTAENERIVVGRHAGAALIRWLHGEPISGDPDPAASRPEESAVVEVAYQRPGHTEARTVPMTVRESIDLLRSLPARTNSWAVFEGRSGGVVQVKWDADQLWLESPDAATSTSTGRYASLAEAERTVTVLAAQDRVAVSELGNVKTISWQTGEEVTAEG